MWWRAFSRTPFCRRFFATTTGTGFSIGRPQHGQSTMSTIALTGGFFRCGAKMGATMASLGRVLLAAPRTVSLGFPSTPSCVLPTPFAAFSFLGRASGGGGGSGAALPLFSCCRCPTGDSPHARKCSSESRGDGNSALNVGGGSCVRCCGEDPLISGSERLTVLSMLRPLRASV